MSVIQYARRHRAIFALCASLCLIGLACMFYLTLRPSPDFSSLKLPAWLLHSRLIKLADKYGELRNIPAFFLLAIPFRVIFRDRGERWLILALLFLLSLSVEVAQIWIPSRHFDRMDILCSWLGLCLGWGLTAVLQKLIARWKRNKAEDDQDSDTLGNPTEALK